MLILSYRLRLGFANCLLPYGFLIKYLCSSYMAMLNSFYLDGLGCLACAHLELSMKFECHRHTRTDEVATVSA